METEINYDNMHYILDNDGYIEEVSFGNLIECNGKGCIEYNGTIPDGYESLEDWFLNANIRAYKIVNNNLTYDENRDNELQRQYQQEQENFAPATINDVKTLLNDITHIVDDEMAENKKGGSVIELDSSTSNDIPKLQLRIDGKPKSVSGSDLTINDNSIEDVKSLTINGVTEQETTEGKNLFKTEASTSNLNGLTVTTNDDGSLNVSGTSTNTWSNITKTFQCNLEAGTYTLSIGDESITWGNVYFKTNYEDGTSDNRGVWGRTTSTTFTTSKKITSIYVYIADFTNGISINKTFYLQVEKGSEYTGYEKYTNGVSPNPSYPQQLKSVKSRNLLDVSKSVTSYVNHNDGNLVSSTASMTSDYIELLSDKVTFSSKYDTLSSTNNRSFGFYDKDKNFISAVYFTQTNKIKTFTKPTNAKYMRVCYDKNCYDVQLEDGSIVSKYVPYGYIRYQNNNGINNIEVEQGGISSSNGYLFDSVNRVRTKDYIEYSEFNILDVAKGINQVAVHFYDEDKTWVSTLGNWYDLPYEITFPSNAKYVKFVFRRSDDSNITSNEVEGVHLYNQSKQVDFYLGNEQLRKIRDLKDKIEVDLKTGDYYKVSNIGEKILTGNETISALSGASSDTSKYYQFQGLNLSGVDGTKLNVLCDYYKGTSANNNWNTRTGCNVSLNENGTLQFRDSINLTLDSFKTFFQNKNANGTPVKIIYILATPTKTKLGTLTSEELEQLKLFSDTNSISVSSHVKPIIDLTYLGQEIYANKFNVSVTSFNKLLIDNLSTSIDGVDITINEDKSITLSGTTTNDIEYTLNGLSTNESPIFMLLKDKNYKSSSLPTGVSINLYSFDGIDNELVYSGSNDTITLSDNKFITHSTLTIASGTTLDITIYPSITLGNYTGEFVEGNANNVINVEYDFNAGDIVSIERDVIKLIRDEEEIELSTTKTLRSFKPNTLIEFDYNGTSNVDYFSGEYINEIVKKIYTTQDAIISEVSKKVGKEELGTEITQNAESIKVAWNQISDYVKIEDASFNIYDENNQPLIKMGKSGQDYYSNNEFIGKVGTATINASKTMSIFFETPSFAIVSGSEENPSAPLIWWDDNAKALQISTIEELTNGSKQAELNILMADDKIKFYKEIDFRNVIIRNTGTLINSGLDSYDQIKTINKDESNHTIRFVDTQGSVETYDYWTSDKKFKKNIKDTEVNALEQIKKIPHKEFDWKENNEHVSLGYVAQDLEKINEKFVIKVVQEDESINLQIDSRTIIPYLSKSIQELSEKVEELEKRIKELEGV